MESDCLTEFDYLGCVNLGSPIWSGNLRGLWMRDSLIVSKSRSFCWWLFVL